MRKLVWRFIGVFTVIMSARLGQAALVESDWRPSIGVPGSELVYHEGGIHFTVDHSHGGVDKFDYATRDWEGRHFTLGEDWTLRVGIHLDDASQFVNAYSTIGVEAIRVNWTESWPAPRVVGTSAGSQENQRFAFSAYGLSVNAAADTLLVQTYSASERLLRTYIKLSSGPLEQFNTIDFSNNFLHGMDPDEPLRFRIFGGSRSPSADFGLGIGDIYIDSFSVELGLLVPEPNSALGLAVQIVCALTCNDAAFRRYVASTQRYSR